MTYSMLDLTELAARADVPTERLRHHTEVGLLPKLSLLNPKSSSAGQRSPAARISLVLVRIHGRSEIVDLVEVVIVLACGIRGSLVWGSAWRGDGADGTELR
jgi:hypothetical protein